MIEATGDARAGVLAKQQRHQAVANAYQVLGAADRTRFLIAEGPHGYGENMRQEAFKWLSRWWRSETPGPRGAGRGASPAGTGSGALLHNYRPGPHGAGRGDRLLAEPRGWTDSTAANAGHERGLDPVA